MSEKENAVVTCRAFELLQVMRVSKESSTPGLPCKGFCYYYTHSKAGWPWIVTPSNIFSVMFLMGKGKKILREKTVWYPN